MQVDSLHDKHYQYIYFNDYGSAALTIDIVKAVLTVIWYAFEWEVCKVGSFRTIRFAVIAYSV